jgi:predicted transposase YdaD
MTKPYDATTRELIDLGPLDWLRYWGFPVPDPSLVEVVDSNVSTFTAEADKAIRIGGPRPMIVHAEILAGRDLTLLERLFWYNTLLRRRHKVPVWSVAVLLRPAADGPELTGRYVESFPHRGRNLWFKYDVVRVWQQPPERLLAAGLPVLPLAPVSDVSPERLPEVLAAVATRLKREAAPALQETLWAATKLMMGLNYPDERIEQLVKGVDDMILGIRGIEESSVYQSIFAKGKAEGKAEGEAKGKAEGEAKGKAEGKAEGIAETLLRVGAARFGAPNEQVETAIIALSDRERLLRLVDRLNNASSWDELLESEQS